MTKLPPLVVICGPTTSGKSSLGLQLARDFGGYIISADSRQVYRGMDIGTAKPTKDEQQLVKHFLLDVVDPSESFTLADYQREVFGVLKKNKELPFLVGGTGLYISSILENWDIPAGSVDAGARQDLEKMTVHLLVKRLQKIDPASAAVIDLNNKRRVIRALEVAEQTGESIVTRKKRRPFPYRVLQIGLSVPRSVLVQRINDRVEAMMKQGLLDEVRALGKRFGWDAPAMSGIGYQQLGQHVRGELRLDEAVERIKIASRQYAKRQMTWFQRQKNISWISDADAAVSLVGDFLRLNPTIDEV